MPLFNQEYKWLSVKPGQMLEGRGGNLAMGLCLIQGGVLVSSCLGNRDELWLGGPLSLRTDFIFNSTLKSFLEIKNSWLWPFSLSFQDFNVDSLHCWHWYFTLEIWRESFQITNLTNLWNKTVSGDLTREDGRTSWLNLFYFFFSPCTVE